MQSDEAPAIVALAADMLFASRIRGAGDAAGVRVACPTSEAAARAALERAAPELVFVDLELRWTDPVAFIAELKSGAATRDIRVIAFAPHVRTEVIEAARDAGADRVMARSAFVRELPALLAGAAS